MPIVEAFGICLLVNITDTLYTLVVQKNATYACCDVLLGRYATSTQLKALLPQLTCDEYSQLRRGYKVLFYHIFGDSRMVAAHIAKYNECLRGYAFDETPTGVLMFEWPKGRKHKKNQHEKPTQTGLREFKEETGINIANTIIVDDATYLVYRSTNVNTGVTYVSKIFIATMPDVAELPVIPKKIGRDKETRAASWVPVSQLAQTAQALIRDATRSAGAV
jgi:8-oxo-dGTP pyrophosphatase MutT (NUDIX family)